MQCVHQWIAGRHDPLRGLVTDGEALVALWSNSAWVAVAFYAVHRLSAVVERFAPVIPESTALHPPEVPEDLLAIAMGEQEAWAQEEVLRAIREKYELLGDWNRVRSAFGVGRRD